MSLDIMPAVRRYSLFHDGDAVLAGVSGGADSMALLHILCSLRETMHLRVYAAHVHHGLRGPEADGDEAYVREMCARWGVELFVRRADIRSEAARTGETEEEAGRRVRYDFFRRMAAPLGAKIATAHTLSDSIETVLFNFCRGTGLRGLCGIPPRRGDIIRPLIECTRRETEEYCARHAIRYRQDSTNFEREHSRNRIRLDVVPVLASINPAFSRAALRAMRGLSLDESLLASLAGETLEKARLGERAYSAPALAACHPALRGRALAQAVRDATGVSPDALHIGQLGELLSAGGGCVQLAGGWFARLEEGKLTFPAPDGEKTGPAPFCVPFGCGAFENGGFHMEITRIIKNPGENPKNIFKRYFNNMIDCDKIIGKAVIRSRMAGDRYSPAGRGIRKSLKKLFAEASIPVGNRWLLPVVSDDRGIIWVYGFGVDERCRIDEHTESLFRIETEDLGGREIDGRYPGSSAERTADSGEDC